MVGVVSSASPASANGHLFISGNTDEGIGYIEGWPVGINVTFEVWDSVAKLTRARELCLALDQTAALVAAAAKGRAEKYVFAFGTGALFVTPILVDRPVGIAIARAVALR